MFSMIFGWPPSMIAMAELVVPRSIPKNLCHIFILNIFLFRPSLAGLAAAKRATASIRQR
jgi:hypothetical protein